MGTDEPKGYDGVPEGLHEPLFDKGGFLPVNGIQMMTNTSGVPRPLWSPAELRRFLDGS